MGACGAVVAEGAYPPTEAAMSAILTTSGLTKGWGAVQAVRGVDVRFKTGCRHAIIGPNGAGKTTLLNLLAGALAPQQGQVFYRGQDITAWDQAQDRKSTRLNSSHVASSYAVLCSKKKK